MVKTILILSYFILLFLVCGSGWTHPNKRGSLPSDGARNRRKPRRWLGENCDNFVTLDWCRNGDSRDRGNGCTRIQRLLTRRHEEHGVRRGSASSGHLRGLEPPRPWGRHSGERMRLACRFRRPRRNTLPPSPTKEVRGSGACCRDGVAGSPAIEPRATGVACSAEQSVPGFKTGKWRRPFTGSSPPKAAFTGRTMAGP